MAKKSFSDERNIALARIAEHMQKAMIALQHAQTLLLNNDQGGIEKRVHKIIRDIEGETRLVRDRFIRTC